MENHKIIIGLVDADLLNGGTRHPNLVLLKLAGFLNDNGILFHLIIDKDEDVEKYTKIFISKVFAFTPDPLFYEKAKGTIAEKKFKVGGTGDYAIKKDVNDFKAARTRDMNQLENDEFLNRYPNKRGGKKLLGIDVRRQMPYYKLYDEYVKIKIAEGRRASYFNDYLYYSIGFLTRGCMRHCPFCVNKLENEVYPYSDLEWFLDEERDEKGNLVRPYIYLWDDNFLAASKEIWKPMLQKLIDSKRPFQFRQGLDERILAESEDGEEIALMLSKCKYHGDFIFAFDNWRDREKIIKALKIWKRYNPKRMTKFYLFCGYTLKAGEDEKLYNDIKILFERIRILMQYGCFGYVMRHADYENHEQSNIYVQIARWCNQPQFYRYMSFWEYCYRNQSYWEQKTKKLDVPNQIPFQEFEERLKTGYYVKDGLRLCKTIQTLVDFMSKFQEHREELLEMFNYKLKELENPTLWIK
ncbi:hypothetical protein H8S77_02735 [Parabacteroides sp. BX2]|uniref:Radical SAM protein n=1 Tax=Parabacteroides segnis TaxID=2763058 RepID=A0ABR7DWA5_9BACT|nr:hypothetical protein [Parabacteroides segnis]MBC5641808.1 hypothetical protein [Parabacteroides segnis]